MTVSDNGNVIRYSVVGPTRNSVTDSHRIIKIGMWVGREKHCTRNTLKVKRSKVKVTRSCNVVAPKHRIYPVNVTHLSYRKSRSPERMAGSDF